MVANAKPLTNPSPLPGGFKEGESSTSPDQRTTTTPSPARPHEQAFFPRFPPLRATLVTTPDSH